MYVCQLCATRELIEIMGRNLEEYVARRRIL